MLEHLHQLMVSLLLVCRLIGQFAQSVVRSTRFACETIFRSMSHRYCLVRSPIGCVAQSMEGWPLGGRNPQTAYFSGQQQARLLLQARSSLTAEDESSQSIFALGQSRL